MPFEFAPGTSSPIRLRESIIPGEVPVPAELVEGELAVNSADRVLFFRTAEGVTELYAPYHLSATTTNATPTKLTGDSLSLENGEAWQFEVKLVAQNKKTSGTKVWSIRGGIRRTFAGAVTIVGSLDTQTTGSIGGGSVSVTADAATQGLAITVTGLATASVDWLATVLTSEKTSTQQPQVGGCTDPDVSNYDSAADYDDGSCSYSAVPSSAALEPIASEDEIETLEVTVGESVLYPTFDVDIHDYCVSTSAAYLGSVTYSVTINDGEPIEGTAKAGRTLQINDGTNYYYVRLLPSDVVVGSVEFGPTENYVPGYYLAARDVNGGGDKKYFYVYDHNGVPVWYGRSPTNNPLNTHVGGGFNRLCLNYESTPPRVVARLNSASITKASYPAVASPTYGAITWDHHELLELRLPAARAGNIVGMSYTGGFYIQEQSPTGELVWEWSGTEYFNTTDPEYYHANSVDVDPVTGNVLVSFRDCSAVLCIEYATKDILWVLQGPPSSSYGTLQAVAKPAATANTKWLTISGEPTVEGFQYVGPRAQHDARWLPDSYAAVNGRRVISLFDDQSTDVLGFTSEGAGPYARGVVYEIDEQAGTATHVSSVYSETGTCNFMGNYAVINDGGVLSHSITFPTQHPALVEYVGGFDAEKTKVFAMDVTGNPYRIVKVPLSQFRLDNLRATCGVNVSTGALPSGGGGGGGGGGASLLLHMDGTDGSTTFTDSSANGLTVTPNDAVQISTAESKFGGASALFQGGYLSVGPDPGLAFGTGDFTVEMWVYLNSYLQGVFWESGPFGSGSRPDSFVWFIDSSGAMQVYHGVSYVITSSSEAVPLSQWSHLALVRLNGVTTAYVDGVAVGSTSDEIQCNLEYGLVSAGQEGGASGNWQLDGYVDELRIVKGTAVYTDDFTPPSAPFTS